MVKNELFYVNATVRSSKKHDIYTTTKTKESNEVWLNGKIFLALLIEKYLGDIDFRGDPRLQDNAKKQPDMLLLMEQGTIRGQ